MSTFEKNDDFIKSLREVLTEAEHELSMEEAKLAPFREKVRIRRAALDGATAGSKASNQVSDEEIMAYLAENVTEQDPKHTPEIAAAFGGDGRGFSNRLARMAREGLIFGDSETGYWPAPSSGLMSSPVG